MRPKRPALFLKVSFHGERYALLNMSPSHPQSPNGRIYTIQEPSAACMCSMVNLYGDPVLVCRGKHHEFHRGFCHAPPNWTTRDLITPMVAMSWKVRFHGDSCLRPSQPSAVFATHAAEPGVGRTQSVSPGKDPKGCDRSKGEPIQGPPHLYTGELYHSANGAPMHTLGVGGTCAIQSARRALPV